MLAAVIAEPTQSRARVFRCPSRGRAFLFLFFFVVMSAWFAGTAFELAATGAVGVAFLVASRLWWSAPYIACGDRLVLVRMADGSRSLIPRETIDDVVAEADDECVVIRSAGREVARVRWFGGARLVANAVANAVRCGSAGRSAVGSAGAEASDGRLRRLLLWLELNPWFAYAAILPAEARGLLSGNADGSPPGVEIVRLWPGGPCVAFSLELPPMIVVHDRIDAVADCGTGA
jgi:hypothetical protein